MHRKQGVWRYGSLSTSGKIESSGQSSLEKPRFYSIVTIHQLSDVGRTISPVLASVFPYVDEEILASSQGNKTEAQ